MISVPQDNFEFHVQAFGEAMRAAAQLEHRRDRFIQEAFRRGRSDEFRGDNEAVRQTILPLLHEFFTRPQYVNGDLQAAYEASIRRRNAGTPAPTMVEALMYSLRERRPAALKEPETQRPLAQLSDQQFVEVAARLQKLKPHIAQPWSDQEIVQLFAARKNLVARKNHV